MWATCSISLSTKIRKKMNKQLLKMAEDGYRYRIDKETLEEEGLPVKDIFRKEPGDEPLDVIVDASVRKSRKQAAGAERPQERLRERSSS